MRLGGIAHVRTGDKGDTSQIAVIALSEVDYPLLASVLTARRVAAHLPGLGDGVVATRREVPALGALVFVLDGALGGGVTRSLALDAHGKTLGMQLLDLDLTPAEDH